MEDDVEPTADQLDFLRNNRFAILGVNRNGRAPHLTPVYYCLENGEVVILTTASRYQAKAVRRDPRCPSA
jgi:nitroimidazol reductase NimA-like FMN-containing flavoprotein (pyridoxamine 5'-phosphate oxidase superfamily)